MVYKKEKEKRYVSPLLVKSDAANKGIYKSI